MRKAKRIILSFLAALLLELIVFNFSAWTRELRGYEPVFFPGDDLYYQNWEEYGDGSKISLQDPIIYVDELSIPADELIIRTDYEIAPSNCIVFYTTEPEESFNADKMIILGEVSQELKVPLGETICALRVDLGDEAGFALNDISFSFNEVNWDFSVSRIIAMLVIYWGTWGLSLLQKSPDYGITEKE